MSSIQMRLYSCEYSPAPCSLGASTGDACWRSRVRRPRVRPRQPGTREASGHRPPPLRGAAFNGWTGQDERSESSALGPVKSRPSESRKPRSRSPKSPRWSAERRARFRKARGAARRRLMVAPLGAPSPRACSEEDGNEGAPRAFQKTGAAERWLIRSTAV